MSVAAWQEKHAPGPFTKYDPRASRSGVRAKLRRVRGRTFAVPRLFDGRCERQPRRMTDTIDRVAAARQICPAAFSWEILRGGATIPQYSGLSKSTGELDRIVVKIRRLHSKCRLRFCANLCYQPFILDISAILAICQICNLQIA